MKNKKAIAPVVATVLLIALVLVLILIFFLWARGFVTEQIEKGGSPIEQVCSDVEFYVDFTRSNNFDGGDMQIVNRGNVPINKIGIKFIGSNGDAKLREFELGADVASSSAREFIPLESGVQKLIVYPMILGNVKGKSVNKVSTCLNDGQVINLNS